MSAEKVGPTHAERLGELVRRARKASGLTQRQLALKIGVSHVFVSHVEAAQRSLPPRLLGALCEALPHMNHEDMRERSRLLWAAKGHDAVRFDRFVIVDEAHRYLRIDQKRLPRGRVQADLDWTAEPESIFAENAAAHWLSVLSSCRALPVTVVVPQ